MRSLSHASVPCIRARESGRTLRMFTELGWDPRANAPMPGARPPSLAVNPPFSPDLAPSLAEVLAPRARLLAAANSYLFNVVGWQGITAGLQSAVKDLQPTPAAAAPARRSWASMVAKPTPKPKPATDEVRFAGQQCSARGTAAVCATPMGTSHEQRVPIRLDINFEPCLPG